LRKEARRRHTDVKFATSAGVDNMNSFTNAGSDVVVAVASGNGSKARQNYAGTGWTAE
jgi:hypothetical protein